MMKIMFVCHGNICRSPMAEFIFKDMMEKCGREKEFAVASSATSAEEIWNGIGNPVYPPAKAELAEHGISCERNIINTMRIFGDDLDNKVRRLLKNKDVSDPWYTDRFDVAYSDIYDGCCQLLESL